MNCFECGKPLAGEELDAPEAAPSLIVECEESLRLLLIRLNLADICDDEKRHIDTLRAAIAKAKGQ